MTILLTDANGSTKYAFDVDNNYGNGIEGSFEYCGIVTEATLWLERTEATSPPDAILTLLLETCDGVTPVTATASNWQEARAWGQPTYSQFMQDQEDGYCD